MTPVQWLQKHSRIISVGIRGKLKDYKEDLIWYSRSYDRDKIIYIILPSVKQDKNRFIPEFRINKAKVTPRRATVFCKYITYTSSGKHPTLQTSQNLTLFTF